MFFVVTPIEYLLNIKDSSISLHENNVIRFKLLHVHLYPSRGLQRARGMIL